MIATLAIVIGLNAPLVCPNETGQARWSGLRQSVPSLGGTAILSVYDLDQNRQIGASDVAMVETWRGPRGKVDQEKRWFEIGARLAKQLEQQRRRRRMRTACVGLVEANGLSRISSAKQLGRYLRPRKHDSAGMGMADIDEAMYAQGKRLCSKGRKLSPPALSRRLNRWIKRMSRPADRRLARRRIAAVTKRITEHCRKLKIDVANLGF